MKHALQFIALFATLGLAACVEDQTYPLSGEECTADDPVLDISGDDCISPTGTGI